MAIVSFGPWEPDNAGIDVPVLKDARNVYPEPRGYSPIPSLADFPTDAPLPEACLGLYLARTSTGSYIIFAGTKGSLFKLVSGVWTDVSKTGGYAVPDDEFWSFAQFGSTLIAVNSFDDPQFINVDAGAAFDDLAGSPPKARYVAVVGDFVILASVSTNQRMLIYSDINDPTEWTPGTGLCDEQVFPDGGRITGVAGGEFGYVVQENAIRQMIFQPGSSIAFRFERVEQERGATGGYSLAASASAIFFLAEEGFYRFDAGNGIAPVGAKRVNQWFRANCDTSRLFQVYGFRDPAAPRVMWAFYAAETSTVFDRLLIYDWQLNRWSYSDAQAQFWASVAAPGLTLEDLDVYGALEDVPFSLDSRVWEGGRPSVSGITTTGALAFLEGSSPMPARLSPAPLQMGGSARAKLTDVYPYGVWNGSTVQLVVGKRDHSGAPIFYTSAVTMSTRTGWLRPYADAKIFDLQFEIVHSTGTPWTLAQGFEAQPSGTGAR